MEDVKMPEPMQLSSAPTSEPTTIPTLDGWIESLMSCKQLAESDVQRLCDKVCDIASRRKTAQIASSDEHCATGPRGTPGRVQRTASGTYHLPCDSDIRSPWYRNAPSQSAVIYMASSTI
jgi:hypothetical protein